ncbi:MAG TPA: translation initiation factor IF-2 subunit beta [Candidatus Nanoarchaeia archaeon]|nr:translation initiation factor IF-2 subunit beta [Candidatus Nanoarchaeia archaeon]
MKTYEQMLDEGIKLIPKEFIVTSRFEIPKAKGHIQGNKTVIINFAQIIGDLRREKDHFLKYLLKELATPGIFDGPRLVLGRKVSASFINDKIKVYTETFVLCNECGKPDTQIVKKDDGSYLKCGACGAQRKIKI